MKKLVLLLTHLVALGAGFGLGVYTLPLLIAPSAPSSGEVSLAGSTAQFSGEFRRDLKGSDFLHWGEGKVWVGSAKIALEGKLAPGPDYKLYLSPEFVETKADFERLKSRMVRVGDVRTFDNFVVEVPTWLDVSRHKAVIVWCESFSQFITAARYQ